MSSIIQGFSAEEMYDVDQETISVVKLRNDGGQVVLGKSFLGDRRLGVLVSGVAVSLENVYDRMADEECLQLVASNIIEGAVAGFDIDAITMIESHGQQGSGVLTPRRTRLDFADSEIVPATHCVGHMSFGGVTSRPTATPRSFSVIQRTN